MQERHGLAWMPTLLMERVFKACISALYSQWEIFTRILRWCGVQVPTQFGPCPCPCLCPSMSFFWDAYDDSRMFLFDDGDPPAVPPGSPPTVRYTGPWLQTQLVISLSIGIVSFLTFSYCRTRWPVLFAPRTKLKGLCTTPPVISFT